MKINACARLRISAGRETGEGAGALFLCTSTGRYLLCKRSDDGDAPGLWCGLGGGRDRMENGDFEPLQHTVRREAFEEAGFPMDAPADLHFVDESNTDGFKFTNFLCLVDREFTPTLNDEHTDYAWKKWTDFPEDQMHPQMMKAFDTRLGRLLRRKYE